VTDFRYIEEAEANASKDFSCVMPKDRMAFLEEHIKKNGIRTVGYESTSMTVAEYHRFSDALSAKLVPMADILTEMRAVKSDDEILKIKKAQEIADLAFSHLLSVMQPSMTETELALELSYFMQKHGASGNSFDIIAVSGEASALPHGKCRNQTISRGFLTLDFGCIYENYCSDMTRTVVIGKADDEMKRLYRTVLEAQEAALCFLKEGVSCAAADKVARDIIEGAGYRGAFGHSLGHGVGLNIHESPSLSPYAKERLLQRGHVVTVEPGIYLAGKYGCRIEDMGAVLPHGFDNFTHSTKELIELF
jgi:Xaa-Pro aminopeptidase